MVIGFLANIIVPLLVISPLEIETLTTSGSMESFLREDIACEHVSRSIAVIIIRPFFVEFIITLFD